MGFSSRSSRNSQYKSGNYGSNHYQQKGFLNNLLNMIGSGRNSNGRDNQYQQPNFNQPPNQQPNFNQPPNQQPNFNQPPNQQQLNGETTICVKCQSQIPRGSKFCLECGEKANSIGNCGNCGEKLVPNAKFCAQCGTRTNG